MPRAPPGPAPATGSSVSTSASSYPRRSSGNHSGVAVRDRQAADATVLITRQHWAGDVRGIGEGVVACVTATSPAAREDRIAEPWGARTPFACGGSWPARVDCFLEDGVDPDAVDRWVGSASVLHSNGDALDIAVAGGRIV